MKTSDSKAGRGRPSVAFDEVDDLAEGSRRPGQRAALASMWCVCAQGDERRFVGGPGTVTLVK